MDDGRFDSARVVEAARHLAKASVHVRHAQARPGERHRDHAVLFGALAGSGVLPLSRRPASGRSAAPAAAPRRACAALRRLRHRRRARPFRQSPRRRARYRIEGDLDLALERSRTTRRAVCRSVPTADKTLPWRRCEGRDTVARHLALWMPTRTSSASPTQDSRQPLSSAVPAEVGAKDASRWWSSIT